MRALTEHLRRYVTLTSGFLLVAVNLLPLTFSSSAYAAGLAIDKTVVKHQTGGATSITSGSFTTSQAGELLEVFLMADGPNPGASSFSSVTGAGLTWSMRARSNTQAGDSEVWQAWAPNVLTNVTVKATRASGSYTGSMVVVAFTGAAQTQTGTTATANAAGGASGVSLVTTANNSWVFGVGNDWDTATARTLGSGQTMVDQYMSDTGDDYWTQRQTTTTPSVGTNVTINDTAPTGDRWNLAAIEVVAAGGTDTQAPTVPANVTATASTSSGVAVSWTASTDNVGVAGYKVFRGGTQVSTVTTPSYVDNNVAPNTLYTYNVSAYDSSGNTSALSADATVTTLADTTPPAISNVAASSISQTGATITWTTDEASNSQVEYGTTNSYGSTTPLNVSLVTSHSAAVTGLSPSTQYHYRVDSADGSGNMAMSADGTFTTADPVQDTTPPTISLTAPANGATLSGTVNVTANANDNIGVVGVQFKLDGANLGSEDATAPYATSWDTTMASSGTHTLSAVARDAAGNAAATSNVTVTVNNGGSDPSQVGQWSAPVSIPAVAIHSALLSTGKVLLWQGDFTQGGQQFVFDPVTNTTVQIPNAQADLFCAGQAVLADGKVMVIGGTSTQGGLGVPDVTAFNQTTQSWQNLAPMQNPRWYATGTTLSDGKVLVNSGANQGSGDIIATPELYAPNTNTWQTLTNAANTMPLYPFIYQLTDGRVVHLGGSELPTASEVLDLNTGQWTTFDSRVIDGGSIANYAPNKFIKAGSAADDGNSGNSLNTAYTLDMNQPGAIWQPTNSMQFPRSFLNLTNLPDGTVLATGGDTDKSGFNDAHGVLAAEDWDPSTGQWKTLASMTTPRLYHSVAVLLPDGRVYVAGGGGDPGVPDHKDVQIYSPAYLFKGARPTITSAPSTVQYNTNQFIATPDAANITRVSLIRTGSVTHAFDENARAVQLNFTVGAGGLNVQMPQNGNFAPPGYYMLFIVNGNGVPSVASFVRFPAPYEDSTPPAAPTDLIGTGNVGTASLSWTGATDNVGVTGYTIYRSTNPGFTPSIANQIGQTATTSFTDMAPAGTYYYRVTAQDGAGNSSSGSNEVSVTVLADTTPPSAPTNLTANASAGNLVTLSWAAATDDVGVTGYQIWRNGSQIATTGSTTYADSTVSPNTSYGYTVRAYDAAGNSSGDSNTANVTTPQSVPVSLDKVVSTHQTTAASTISMANFSTAQTNELLVAFLTSDGGSGGQSFSSVSGGGLLWTLRQRTNTQMGTAEIWQAVAPTVLNNVTITAARSSGSYTGSMSVAAFIGASTTTNGAVASANAGSGAPSASLTTTRNGSWVWGVGDDWDTATSRTVGANQTKVDEFLSPSGDTFWTQRQANTTSTAGTSVTINDTVPTADRWNLALIEIIPAS